MIIEIDSTFTKELQDVLSKYQDKDKERFKEDCMTLQCMIKTQKYGEKPIAGVSDLVDTLMNYCKKELRNNTIRFPFTHWTIYTRRNGLYLALKRTIHQQLTKALFRENTECHTILGLLPTPEEFSAMESQTQQLEKDLNTITAEVKQAKTENGVKEERIQELVEENASLDQHLQDTKKELKNLKGKVIYLEEEKFPNLELYLEKRLVDFQEKMIKENEKQMADFITSRKKDIPGRPTHRFSSPSIFSAGFWPHHTEEHAVPLLGKDHPKPGKTGQRGMIT